MTTPSRMSDAEFVEVPEMSWREWVELIQMLLHAHSKAELESAQSFEFHFKDHDEAIAWISDMIRRGSPTLHGVGIMSDGIPKIMGFTFGGQKSQINAQLIALIFNNIKGLLELALRTQKKPTWQVVSSYLEDMQTWMLAKK